MKKPVFVLYETKKKPVSKIGNLDYYAVEGGKL